MRQGESTAYTRATRRASLLDRRNDWELRKDVDRKLAFSYIMKTNLRPDSLLVAISLSVP